MKIILEKEGRFMYRTWLSEKEFNFLKNKMDFNFISKDEKDQVIFVDCINFENWKLLNEYLASKIK